MSWPRSPSGSSCTPRPDPVPGRAGLRADLSAVPDGWPSTGRAGRRLPAPAADDHLDLARAGLVALMALPGCRYPGSRAVFGTALLSTPFATARAGLLTEVLPGVGRRPAIGTRPPSWARSPGCWRRRAGRRDRPVPVLALDSLSFSLSAGILACWVRARPHRRTARTPAPPRRSPGGPDHDSVARRCASWCCSAGCAASRGPGGTGRTVRAHPGRRRAHVGLLLAAPPAGLLIGAFVLGRLIRPADRLRPMGWLAMLSCAPLISAGRRRRRWSRCSGRCRAGGA